MITVIQRAKFFLMREKHLAVERDHLTGRAEVVEELAECGPVQPAIVEIDGFRLRSDTPKTAAEAAKINEAIDRLRQTIPPTIP